MNNNYTIKSVEEYGKELTKKERFRMMKTKAELIKKHIGEEITIRAAIICDIHNESSTNPDYQSIILMDDTGALYTSSSSSFMGDIRDIYQLAVEEGENPIIKVYEQESNKQEPMIRAELVIREE